MAKQYNKTAFFWHCDREDLNVKHYTKHDSYSFGIDLIVSLYNWSQGVEQCPELLTEDDIRQVKITHHMGDHIGHDVTIKAPLTVWKKARAALSVARQ